MTSNSPWQARILTLFPDIFPGPLAASLAGIALEKDAWSISTTNIRDFAHDKHGSVDGSPAGGGPGMVLRADVVAAAIDDATSKLDLPLIYLTPKGVPLTQKRVRELANGPGAILLCGRFEGLDERVIEARQIEEISIGDYVLAGGEIAAMVLLEAVIRLLPCVMGSDQSGDDESFEAGLLEYPQYTRPRNFEDREIPDILLSGDHGKIAEWRRAQAENITKARRPDLWAAYRAGIPRDDSKN